MILLFFNPDPKIKPKICSTEGCNFFVESGKFCNNCIWKATYSKKKRLNNNWNRFKNKIPKTNKINLLSKAIKKAERGSITADKLFKKGLTLWSDIIRGNDDYTHCKTCGKPLKTRDGLSERGAQAGHYLDKFNHWKLAFRINNGITQGKCCNVDPLTDPRRVELMKIEMRIALVNVHGEESIRQLEIEGNDFRNKVKQGFENSKPRTHDPLAQLYNRPTDVEFLKNEILNLTKILKNEN